jgi:hypothetical protein
MTNGATKRLGFMSRRIIVVISAARLFPPPNRVYSFFARGSVLFDMPKPSLPSRIPTCGDVAVMGLLD